MAIAPIDYQSLLTQLDFTPVMQGLQLRGEREAATAARAEQSATRKLAEAKFTQEQENDAIWQADLADLSTNFSPTRLRDMMWKHPDKQAALKSGFDTYNSYQQRSVVGATTSVLGALAAGNTELAQKVLSDRRAALISGGVNTNQTDALLRLVKSPDPADKQQAYAMLGLIMSGAVEPEHAAGIMENFGIGAKAEDRQRDNVRADAQLSEQERHNRVVEGQGASRVALSRDRVNRGRDGGNAGVGSDAASSVSTIGGKTYVKRNGRWFEQ